MCGPESSDWVCHLCHSVLPSSNGVASPPRAATGCKSLPDTQGTTRGQNIPWTVSSLAFTAALQGENSILPLHRPESRRREAE